MFSRSYRTFARYHMNTTTLSDTIPPTPPNVKSYVVGEKSSAWHRPEREKSGEHYTARRQLLASYKYAVVKPLQDTINKQMEGPYITEDECTYTHFKPHGTALARPRWRFSNRTRRSSLTLHRVQIIILNETQPKLRRVMSR